MSTTPVQRTSDQGLPPNPMITAPPEKKETTDLITSSSSPSSTISSTRKSGNVLSTEEGHSKKPNVASSQSIPKKLPSIRQKSDSFQMPAQYIPKSPRQLKEQPGQSEACRTEKTGLPSSARSHSGATAIKLEFGSTSATPTQQQTDGVIPSSIPVVKILKAKISSELLKQLEAEHIDHTLINLLIDDVCKQSLSLDSRHALGRTDSAFYINNLPEVLKPFTKDIKQSTISSSKLLQAVFSERFRTNTGWVTAKIIYANSIFQEKSSPKVEFGKVDPSTESAEREKLKGIAEILAKSIFGHPASIKKSPLPSSVIDALIYADQCIHEKLLTNEKTQTWSTEQIRDARQSIIKLLTVTRLLMPMVTALAEKNPDQKEVWLLGLILQTFIRSASQLSKEIFVESFAKSSDSLRKLAQEKEKIERIHARTKTFKTKKPAHHTRSRSADTTIIDINSLSSPADIRKKRALEKTQKMVNEIVVDDDTYERVITEGKKRLQETEELRKAEADIKDFSVEDLEQIQQMLAARLEDELMSLLPEGEIVPDKPEPLPTSTTDIAPTIYSDTHEKAPKQDESASQ
jgi:hypothetical protein